MVCLKGPHISCIIERRQQLNFLGLPGEISDYKSGQEKANDLGTSWYTTNDDLGTSSCNEEVIEVIRIMAKRLRSQLEETPNGQTWNKWHINKDKNYNGI